MIWGAPARADGVQAVLLQHRTRLVIGYIATKLDLEPLRLAYVGLLHQLLLLQLTIEELDDATVEVLPIVAPIDAVILVRVGRHLKGYVRLDQLSG